MRGQAFADHAPVRSVGCDGPVQRLRPALILRRTFTRALLTFAFAGGAAAQGSALSDGDRSAIRDTISKQVEAFRHDDADTAFGLASPTIQAIFGSAGAFMDMVRQGYQPVYRPKAFDFGEIVELDGRPTQKVHVVGPEGRRVTAFYPMTQQSDGSWRIDGCYLEAPDEHQA
ncbi:MAG: DUF4864 domain-containing protein [Enhydrobacter sp.]|nr:DUF4864 domain-containing protein [Enhydrobacter sp.]